MQHHAIIVSNNWGDWLDNAHQKAGELCEELVTPISPYTGDGYRSFAILPDGSKEGWDTSDKFEERRSLFLDYLRSLRYEDGSSPLDWVLVQFGDDELETKVLEDDDEPLRARRSNPMPDVVDRCLIDGADLELMTEWDGNESGGTFMVVWFQCRADAHHYYHAENDGAGDYVPTDEEFEDNHPYFVRD